MSQLIPGMSSNMPKMLSSEFQSHSIRIQYFKIIAINPFILLASRGRMKFINLVLRISYDIPNMLS